MQPVLAVSGLEVRRGPTTILRNLSWRIEPGQHWVILGSNGSGKTSLLKALTGYIMPTSGEISVFGERYGASDWRDLRLKIGVVTSAFVSSIPPAEVALDTVISGKFAQLDLWAKTTDADRRAARLCLRRVGLLALAGREWALLSQGEKQRVLIARALMTKPRLLILDEPAAGLDPVARQQFLDFIQGLAARHDPRSPALVLVTHHVEEILPGFEYILLLRGGEVVAAGPRPAVLTSAALTRTFGAPVKLRRTGGRYRLDIGKSR